MSSQDDDILDSSQSADARDPDFIEGLDQAFAYHLSRMQTAAPGVVQSYDRTTQRADVQLGVAIRLPDGTTAKSPLILNAPVVFPGAAGFSITYDVPKGSEVLVIFAQSSIDEWVARGGINQVASSPRRFSGADAIILPGLRSAPNKLTGAPTDEGSLVIKNAAGVRLELRQDGVATLYADSVRLGSDAATALPLDALVQAELAKLAVVVNELVTKVNTLPPTTPVIPPYVQGATASNKVRGE